MTIGKAYGDSLKYSPWIRMNSEDISAEFMG